MFEIIIKGRDGPETGLLPQIYSINYNIDDLSRDLWPLLELKLPAVCLGSECLLSGKTFKSVMAQFCRQSSREMFFRNVK